MATDDFVDFRNMIFEGKLSRWNDERGFGFVTPDQGGDDLFIHISAFPRGGPRPELGEPLRFEVDLDPKGQKRAIRAQRLRKLPASATSPQRHRTPRHSSRETRSRAGVATMLVLVLCLGGYGYAKWSRTLTTSTHGVELGPEMEPHEKTVSASPEIRASFSCDGRAHCSQMTSCAEAKYFLSHCPDVKMDGDRDGVPCEEQWCTSPLAK